jgi:hypothetical protein
VAPAPPAQKPRPADARVKPPLPASPPATKHAPMPAPEPVAPAPAPAPPQKRPGNDWGGRL